MSNVMKKMLCFLFFCCNLFLIILQALFSLFYVFYKGDNIFFFSCLCGFGECRHACSAADTAEQLLHLLAKYRQRLKGQCEESWIQCSDSVFQQSNTLGCGTERKSLGTLPPGIVGQLLLHNQGSLYWMTPWPARVRGQQPGRRGPRSTGTKRRIRSLRAPETPSLPNEAGERAVTSSLRTSKSTVIMKHGMSNCRGFSKMFLMEPGSLKLWELRWLKLWTCSCRTRWRVKCWRLSRRTRKMTTVQDLWWPSMWTNRSGRTRTGHLMRESPRTYTECASTEWLSWKSSCSSIRTAVPWRPRLL